MLDNFQLPLHTSGESLGSTQRHATNNGSKNKIFLQQQGGGGEVKVVHTEHRLIYFLNLHVGSQTMPFCVEVPFLQ